jgi:uncharacterized protein
LILTDAGPLVALINRSEKSHSTCKQALGQIHGPLVSTWPAVTEAMCILGERIGWAAQEQLWKLILSERLEVLLPDKEQTTRIRNLMERYRDLPMDLADASLVALAETLNTVKIFTIDSDFRVYRLPGNRAFEIVP